MSKADLLPLLLLLMVLKLLLLLLCLLVLVAMGRQNDGKLRLNNGRHRLGIVMKPDRCRESGWP